jgi:serine/threonine protein phosphatase PrpC
MSLESHGVSDPGCVRTENEDRILLEPSLGLYAVCDGMGGHQHGEVAAELAIAAMRYYVDVSRDRFDVTWPFGFNFNLSADANRLVTGVKLANREIWRRAEQKLECAGMGTTVAAVLLDGSQVVVANAGDSRVYRFRNGELELLTEDDTMVGSMTQKGLLSEDEARNHPMRNVLTQAAGSVESIEVHVREEALQSGDLLLISSDGLHGVIEPDVIRSLLARTSDVDRCSRRLVEAAREAGAPDNVSVVVLRYD